MLKSVEIFQNFNISTNVNKCQQNVTNVNKMSTKCHKCKQNVNKMSTKCQQMSTKCHKCQQNVTNVNKNFAKFCNFFVAKSENISKFFEILQFFLKTVET
jgi:hypothetical protein